VSRLDRTTSRKKENRHGPANLSTRRTDPADLTLGDRWVHLRLCLTCGHVGCCDSSKNKHATKHFHTTGHPVMKSVEPGEDWAWCYVDEIMFDSV
jgi:uncharacterized UBP type Zn finger protein